MWEREEVFINDLGQRFIPVPHKWVRAQWILRDESATAAWKRLEGKISHAGEAPQVCRDERAFFAPGEESLPAIFSAEVFAHEYYLLSLGSSRHMQLENFQWKGVGRNHLAVRSDWRHSWGGLTWKEALAEYITAQYLGAELAVPVLGVGRYLEGEYRGHFLLRDLSAPRVATLPYGKIRLEHAANLARLLRDIGAESEPLFLWRQVLLRWQKLIASAIVIPQFSVANIDVLGRLLDLQGVLCLPGKAVTAWLAPVSAQLAGTSLREQLLWVATTHLIPLYAQIFKAPREPFEALLSSELRAPAIHDGPFRFKGALRVGALDESAYVYSESLSERIDSLAQWLSGEDAAEAQKMIDTQLSFYKNLSAKDCRWPPGN